MDRKTATLGAIGATAAAFVLWRLTTSSSSSSKKKGVSQTSGTPAEWLAELQRELYGSVMPFWMTHSVDADKGGFHSCVARDGSLYDADKKYVWLNGRAVWMMTELVRVTSDEELQERSGGVVTHAKLLEASRRGADFLINFAICRSAADALAAAAENGGVMPSPKKPRPPTPTRRTNTPTRARRNHRGGGDGDAHERVVAALSGPSPTKKRSPSKLVKDMAEASPSRNTQHEKVVAALSSPLGPFKGGEIDHVWSCLAADGAPLQLERKPFSAMFVCQGIANLARVLRDQEAASPSSSSSSSSSDSSSDSSSSSSSSSKSWQHYASHAQQLLDTVLRWSHDPTPLGRPAMSKCKAWNVPMIALSVLDSCFLCEGGLLEGVDAAARSKYEAEASWCVDELLAHMVDDKKVAVENIAPVAKANVEAAKANGDGVAKDLSRSFFADDDELAFGYAPDSWEGRMVIPGHGIECAWFLMDYASMRLKQIAASGGDQEQKSRCEAVFERALTLLDWSFDAGWDDDKHGGGLRYFVDSEHGAAGANGAAPDGLGSDEGNVPMLEKDMKLWWPHTEAMVAFAMAFEHTKDPKHWARFQLSAGYSLDHFSDAPWRRDDGCGEWFGYLDRHGEVTHSFKGGPYKCAFHTPRALLRCTKILERVVAAEEAAGAAAAAQK